MRSRQTKFVGNNLIESTLSQITGNINCVAPFAFAMNSRQNGSEFYFSGYYYFSNGLPSNAEMQGGRDKVW